MHTIKQRLGLLITGLLIAVIAFIGGTAVSSTYADALIDTANSNGIHINQQDAGQMQPVVMTQNEQIYASVYGAVAQSVVSINVIGEVSNPAFRQAQLFGSTGTGFVIDQEGHIVTNSHVVQDAFRVEVNFFNGRIVRGEVIGNDPDSDLAVIRVTDVPSDELIPVTLADSDNLFIGQEVIALGSPFNQPWTMTTGIISALGRSIDGLAGYSIGSVIQTDAAINPGNSGGPLLNLNGQVIGVNAQIVSQTQSNSGIGFAIPSNLVGRVAEALITSGEMNYSYLGITGRGMSLDVLEALNLPSDTQGVVIQQVLANGPAESAGLLSPDMRSTVTIDGFDVPTSLDIITAIDGSTVRDMPALISYLAENTLPGQAVNLQVIRDGQSIVVPVTLGAR